MSYLLSREKINDRHGVPYLYPARSSGKCMLEV